MFPDSVSYPSLEIGTFFNSENSSPMSTTSSDTTLPRAMNSEATIALLSWLQATINGNHMAKVLMATSLVCVLLKAFNLLDMFK